MRWRRATVKQIQLQQILCYFNRCLSRLDCGNCGNRLSGGNAGFTCEGSMLGFRWGGHKITSWVEKKGLNTSKRITQNVTVLCYLHMCLLCCFWWSDPGSWRVPIMAVKQLWMENQSQKRKLRNTLHPACGSKMKTKAVQLGQTWISRKKCFCHLRQNLWENFGH